MLSPALPGTVVPPAGGSGGAAEWPAVATAVTLVVLGIVLAIVGGMPAVLLLGLPVIVLVVHRPAMAAYVFLFANPLIVGIARGEPIPLLRPNELVLAVLLVGFAIRFPARVLSGKPVRPAWDPVDVAIVGLVVAGSLLPVAWRQMRSLPLTEDDLLYAVVLWKYLALYWLFRQAISTPRQVLMCLVLSMASAVLVAIVAMLQVTNQFGVPELLMIYYDSPFTGSRGPVTYRGTSTIASSFGTADVMIMNLLIALALLRAVRWRSWRLAALATVFLSGCFAAGAFSGVIGLVVALLIFGVIARQTGRLIVWGVPMAIVGMVAFWPVIAGRLAGFERPSGLPQSWEGRWANLRDFFLPDILTGVNWLTGVRPAARVPAPEAWRDWVYIESGYVWLVWIGGLPFLLTFLVFVGVCAWRLWPVARSRQDAVGAAAIVSLAYLMVIATLMVLDPHLTIRGSADLFFPLLAVALLQVREPRRARSLSSAAVAAGGHRHPSNTSRDTSPTAGAGVMA